MGRVSGMATSCSPQWVLGNFNPSFGALAGLRNIW